MITYRLDNGKTCELPTVASELRFRQFIDMKAVEQAYFADQTFGYRALPMILEPIIGAEALNELEMYEPASGETPRPIQPEFLTIDMEFDTLSVYNHIYAVIESYRPESADNVIEYAGERYLLDSTDILKGTGKVKVGAAIVAMELGKHFQKLIDIKGDMEGNFAFSLGLLEIAVLARREGEVLPINVSERDKWLEERGRLFEDLPLSEVLKVRFFFRRTLRGYIKTRDTLLSGMSSASPSRQHHKSAKPKPKRRKFPTKKH